MTEFLKVAVAASTLALTALGAPPARAADPRAQDAVDLFVDFCVTDVLSLRPRVADPSRFIAERMTGGAPVYLFRFKASRAKVLTSRGPRGLCAVNVLSADEADIQAAFLRAAERAAAEGGARLEPASELELAKAVTDARLEPATELAKGMTRRSWFLRSEKAKLILSITTSPPSLAAEHLMTSFPTP